MQDKPIKFRIHNPLDFKDFIFDKLKFMKVKKELGIENEDIAYIFGFKNANSYNNSSQKRRIEKGILIISELSRNKLRDIGPTRTP